MDRNMNGSSRYSCKILVYQSVQLKDGLHVNFAQIQASTLLCKKHLMGHQFSMILAKKEKFLTK